MRLGGLQCQCFASHQRWFYPGGPRLEQIIISGREVERAWVFLAQCGSAHAGTWIGRERCIDRFCRGAG